MLAPIEHRIALELSVRPAQVIAAIQLLDEGATVPFIARYRKEVTGELDDTQLRTLEERLGYLRELEDRRGAVLASIEEQGKLTPELKAEIENAETKQRLEDLYLPYKQKRRTKAQIAREAGIEEFIPAIAEYRLRRGQGVVHILLGQWYAGDEDVGNFEGLGGDRDIARAGVALLAPVRQQPAPQGTVVSYQH